MGRAPVPQHPGPRPSRWRAAVLDEALTTVDAALDGPRQTVEGRKISVLVRAQVLVHCGDAEPLAAPATRPARRPVDAATQHEYRMVLSTALVQAGRTGEAIAELEDARTTIAEDAGPGSANNAPAGRSRTWSPATPPKRARPPTTGSTAAPTSTSTSARWPACSACLQDGEPDAIVVDAAVARIDRTEARLDQAGVRVARAHALEALGHPDAEAARRDADARPRRTRDRDAGVGSSPFAPRGGWRRGPEADAR